MRSYETLAKFCSKKIAGNGLFVARLINSGDKKTAKKEGSDEELDLMSGSDMDSNLDPLFKEKRRSPTCNLCNLEIE